MSKTKTKTPAASLKRRKVLLGLPIHIKYQLIVLDIYFYIILVLNRLFYVNYTKFPNISQLPNISYLHQQVMVACTALSSSRSFSSSAFVSWRRRTTCINKGSIAIHPKKGSIARAMYLRYNTQLNIPYLIYDRNINIYIYIYIQLCSTSI